MVSNEKMLVFPHPKHFERLFEIVGVKKTWKAYSLSDLGMF